jgi:putative tryptophan/tyrosine transport system substrate-binding protein
MDRRAFLGTVALAVVAAPRLGETRPVVGQRVPRVGVLGEANPIPWMVKTPVVDLECRWADEQRSSLSELASQLVALDVDVIVAVGAASGRAASQRTARVPIVVVADGDRDEDAVAAGVAQSAGNVAWLSAPSETGMASQRLSLLTTVVSHLRRVALLFNSDTVVNARAATRLSDRVFGSGIELRLLPARTVEDVERAFVAIARDPVDGLLVLADTLFSVHASRLLELAAEARLPTVYGARAFVESGGLMALYGDTSEIIGRTATIVRRILAGEAPATLSSPSRPRPQFALNAVTARRLGLEFPPAVFARAAATLSR